MDIVALIDKALEENQEPPRAYLGASILGQSCPRKLWYDFHWVTPPFVSGRLRRLYDRGHKEEERFCAFLRLVGVKVHEIDPATERQFGFVGYKGHFAGSADGILENVPGIQLRCLVEFKTHADKSFTELRKAGMRSAKFEHYVQMQIYMGELDLQMGVYMAVNKNDDSLYVEMVEFDNDTYQKYKNRAIYIIDSPDPPPKINPSPAWWECKYCDHAQVCHFGKEPQKNCRTCTHSTPIEGGRWWCEETEVSPFIIPEDIIPQGCSYYVKNPTI